MRVIVKYKVEKPFKDKYTKQDIKKDTVLEVSIERMKELNTKNIGRVEDIIVQIDEQEAENTEPSTKSVETDTEENKGQEKTAKYSQEQLKAMNVNELKELAEKENIELTKAKKDEIIAEILEKLQ